MKKKFCLFSKFVALATIASLSYSCEKDLYEDAIQQNQNKEININSVSLEKFHSRLRLMNNKPEIERFMVSSKIDSRQNRTGSSSEFEIITDDIKEITQGDYTSFTMYVKTPDTTNNIYNLTVEETNDNASLFLTKYDPINNWTMTSNQNFEGNVIIYRITGEISDQARLTSLLTEAFESIQEGGSNGMGSGSGGTSTSNSYPYDCNGFVQTTYLLEPNLCDSGEHMPWQTCEYLNPNYINYDPSRGPNYELKPYYTCIPDYIPVDGGTSGNTGETSGGGGTNTGNNNTGGTSLTTIVGDPTPIAVKDPCKVLKESLDPLKQNLNDYINDLVTKHQQSVKNEASYSFEKMPQYDPDTDTYTAFGSYNAVYKDGGPTSVYINLGKRWYSSIHLHPKAQEEASGIFSWQDLRTFADSYNEVIEDLKSEVSMILVAPNPLNFNDYNVYALKVKDISLLSQAVANEWSSPKWSNITDEKKRLEAIQKALGKDYVNNKNNLAQFFLQKFSNYGISLFQLQNNQWKELMLNKTTNQLEEKPCNN